MLKWVKRLFCRHFKALVIHSIYSTNTIIAYQECTKCFKKFNRQFIAIDPGVQE